MSKLSRRLRKIGTQVNTCFAVDVNNDDTKTFSNMDEVSSYLKNYRESNSIFSLSLHRIEIYSL